MSHTFNTVRFVVTGLTFIVKINIFLALRKIMFLYGTKYTITFEDRNGPHGCPVMMRSYVLV